jgi:cyclohexanecarboxylate-CoA ligase
MGIDLPAIQAFLKEQKVAIQYIPERLIVRDALPSTPSGKIQKFKLREMLQDTPS